MNKVVVSGNVVAAPQMRTAGETPVANYTIAVRRNRPGSDGNYESDFIRCVAFGNAAKFAEKYIEKGTPLNVVGRIQVDSYTNKDGQKVNATVVVVEEQEFAGRKPAASTES